MNIEIMKKRILFIVILAAIVGLVFYGNRNVFKNISTAYAVGDLTVDWGIGIGDVGPIFNVLNMAPGDVEEREVDVTNSAASTRPIGVRGDLRRLGRRSAEDRQRQFQSRSHRYPDAREGRNRPHARTQEAVPGAAGRFDDGNPG